MKIELETLEVKIYANLRQFLPFFQQNFKLKNFSLRGQLLRPPYLVPTMCGGLHAKFQDSRINNKKGPPPFHCLGQIMEYYLVWGGGGGVIRKNKFPANVIRDRA